MKTYALFCVIAILSITITVFLYTANNSLRSDDNVDDIDIASIKDELYSFGKELNELYFGVTIPDIFCMDLTGDTIKLSKLVKNENVLVYYYSEFHCNSFYEKQLSLIEDYFSNANQKVVVLSSHLSYRSFKIHLDADRFKLPIYFIGHNAFGKIMKDFGSPFFFVLDQALTGSYFYVDVNDGDTNRIDVYLEKVKNHLSE